MRLVPSVQAVAAMKFCIHNSTGSGYFYGDINKSGVFKYTTIFLYLGTNFMNSST